MISYLISFPHFQESFHPESDSAFFAREESGPQSGKGFLKGSIP